MTDSGFNAEDRDLVADKHRSVSVEAAQGVSGDLHRRAPRLARDSRAFWRHYVGYQPSILAAGSLAGLAAATELLLLAALAAIVSTFGNQTDSSEALGPRINLPVDVLLVAAVALVIVRAAFRLGETYLEARLGSRYERETRAGLVTAFIEAGWPVQSAERGHETQDVMTGAVMWGRVGIKALASSVGSSFSAAIMLLGALATSWVATLSAILLSVTLAVCLQPLVRRSKLVGEKVRDLSLNYVTAFGETVNMAREIRLAGVSESFDERLEAISRRIETQRTHEQMLLGTAPNLFEGGAILIVVAGLAALHFADLDNSARFVAMLLLLLRASQYGRSLQGTYHQVKASLPYLAIIDEREEFLRNSHAGGGTCEVTEFEALELRDVSYSYGSGQLALDRVSIGVRRYDVIGVIGPSGSGKSTLVDLLLGLRTPTSGEYLVDGVPFSQLDPKPWYRLTGLVTQEPQLIEGDLIDNIRFMRDNVSDADIDYAVAASGLGRDMTMLRDGLETRIGPRSSGLSGGQRQRLCIARVLAGRPQLLVLDEPTSSLDVHSESVVTDTLERLKGSIAIVVVAHRLSTLRVCDKVAVIRDGSLEAFGDRAELERNSDYYNSAIDLAHIAR